MKRRKLKSVIVHCEKLSTSQIGFYLIQIWTLNTQCFHSEISENAICKGFPLKFFHKKSISMTIWENKKKAFSGIDFFSKNKMILAHCAVDFFHATLNRKSIWYCLTWRIYCKSFAKNRLEKCGQNPQKHP